MASNALVSIEHNTLPTARDWETMLSMAEVLVKSGMLPAHIKTPQAAVAIIQKGRELGIQPMYALSNIVNIQGKPTANSELMLALIYRDHGDNAITFTASDATACQIAYKRRSWQQAQAYTFTIDDAKAAGLMSNATWQKYPAAMLRARCISAVARMAFPDSIGGMYTPEELGADVDEDGTPIIVQIEPPRDIKQASRPIETVRAAPLSEPRSKPLSDRERLNRKLWATAIEYYGEGITDSQERHDMAHGKLREWVRVQYPDAVSDGEPSVAALSDTQVQEMLDALAQGVEEERDPAPAQAHLVSVREEAPVKGLDER